METFSCEYFSLDTASLWNRDGGPRWSADDESKLEAIDQSLAQKFRGEIGFYQWPKSIEESDWNAIEAIFNVTFCG